MNTEASVYNINNAENHFMLCLEISWLIGQQVALKSTHMEHSLALERDTGSCGYQK